MVEYDIERYLSMRKTHTPSFSPEGDRLSFLSDVTGVLQVWTLGEPGEWPTQQTTFDERVTFASWSPENPEIAFGMDRSADGQTQLFLVGADGAVDRLTDEPDASHRWGGWSSDGTKIAFAANREDSSNFDVYVRPRDPDSEPHRVLKTDGWYDVLGWGPDDERLLLRKTNASLDHELSVLDIKTGNEATVTEGASARYQSVNWGPDGEAAYAVTDRDTDTQYLARIDLNTGELETVVDGGDWNVEGLNLDAETRRLAYGRNVDGYSRLTTGKLIGETQIREYPTPDLPDGVVGEVSFAPTADQFAVTVTTRQQSPTVYAVEFETGATEQWTKPSHAAIPRESFVAPELIRYESFDDREIPAFFSLPDDAGSSVPVLVDLHGGPESQRRPSFNPIRQYLLSRGYALFEPNVRGSTGYGKAYTNLDDGRKRFDAAADVKAGVEWLKACERVDSDRLAVFGSSYGGYLALLCLVRHDVWAAGGSLCGITDLVTFLENTGKWRRSIRETEYGSLEDDREFLERASPARRAAAVDVPTLVIHGENDPRVPADVAVEFAEQVREQDVPVEVELFEDEGHSISKQHNRATAYRTLAAFLDQHLGNKL